MRFLTTRRAAWVVLWCAVVTRLRQQRSGRSRAASMYDREQPTPELMRSAHSANDRRARDDQPAVDLRDALPTWGNLRSAASLAPWTTRRQSERGGRNRRQGRQAIHRSLRLYEPTHLPKACSTYGRGRRAVESLTPPGMAGARANCRKYYGRRARAAGARLQVSPRRPRARAPGPLRPGAGDEEQKLTGEIDTAERGNYEAQKQTAVDPAELANTDAARQHLVDDLARLHEKLSRPVGPSDVADPVNARIVADAVTMTSVALRLATEAVSARGGELGSKRRRSLATPVGRSPSMRRPRPSSSPSSPKMHVARTKSCRRR